MERSCIEAERSDPCATTLPYRKTILRNTLQPIRRERTRSSSVPSKKVSFVDEEKGLPLNEVFEFPKDKPSLSIKASACCLLF